ncbi:transposase [bacterium]
MARPLRIEYPNAWYHIMNRGRRKEPIFFEESDYALFIELLKQTIDLFGVQIHAYALMPNHYHLLVNTPKGNISRTMRHLNGVYTQKINKKYSIDGQLFRGKYKSILINEEEYLMELVRYIHRNPYKANLVEKIGTYKWCSHRKYMGKKNEKEKWLL